MPTFTIRRKLFSISRDYVVRDEQRRTVYRFVGKLRFARRFVIRDASGTELLTVREKLLDYQTFEIRRRDEVIATVRGDINSGLHPRYEIDIAGADPMSALGALKGDGVKLTGMTAAGGTVWVPPATLWETFHATAPSGETQSLILAIHMSIVEMTFRRGQGGDD